MINKRERTPVPWKTRKKGTMCTCKQEQIRRIYSRTGRPASSSLDPGRDCVCDSSRPDVCGGYAFIILANVAGTAGVKYGGCGGVDVESLGFKFGGDADWEWTCDGGCEVLLLVLLLFWRFGSGSLAGGGRYSCMLNVSACVGGGSKMVAKSCDCMCDGGGGGGWV